MQFYHKSCIAKEEKKTTLHNRQKNSFEVTGGKNPRASCLVPILTNIKKILFLIQKLHCNYLAWHRAWAACLSPAPPLCCS